MKPALLAAGLAACLFLPMTGSAEPLRRQVLDFKDLNGWADDDHRAALRVFQKTCGLIRQDGWAGVCKAADKANDARAFFERNFVPVMFEDGGKPLFTGYYEPELSASRQRTAKFSYPIYGLPPDMPRGTPWLTRAEIETSGALNGRGLEIAWLSDPVEVFFLHVQGSGRLHLQDGSAMRVGFAGKNGHKYRSVGREMARLGILPSTRVSAPAIKSWVRQNPDQGAKLLRHNPSYIFFRKIKDLNPDAGPIGAMTVPVSPLRSVAVDPAYTPLGAPVWIEKKGKRPLSRLMVAQDTGSAIKGPQRADIFYGSGANAGKIAGSIRDSGRIIVLLPRAATPTRARKS